MRNGMRRQGEGERESTRGERSHMDMDVLQEAKVREQLLRDDITRLKMQLCASRNEIDDAKSLRERQRVSRASD